MRCATNKLHYLLLIAMAWTPGVPAQTSFVTETPQDLEIAINNFPERVKTGPEVTTILGNQITPGTLPRDFRVNQQIYDDIARVNGHITPIMRMIFALESKPKVLIDIETAINQLLNLLTNLGIRYNISENLSSIRTELEGIKNQLKAIPEGSAVNTILMVPYNRMDVIRYMIVSLLQTKIVGVLQ